MKTQTRILVIEDDRSIPLLLSQWALRYSHGKILVDHAVDPDEAMNRLEGVSAIVLDLTMPPHWHPEATLRLIPEMRKHAPVIVLTGYSRGTESEDSKFVSDAITDHGADFVFFKHMLTAEGLDWFFLIVNAAMARRVYEAKVDKAFPA